jgi:hypothetical protein
MKLVEQIVEFDCMLDIRRIFDDQMRQGSLLLSCVRGARTVNTINDDPETCQFDAIRNLRPTTKTVEHQ